MRDEPHAGHVGTEAESPASTSSSLPFPQSEHRYSNRGIGYLVESIAVERQKGPRSDGLFEGFARPGRHFFRAFPRPSVG
jgi:hypothetical protein